MARINYSPDYNMVIKYAKRKYRTMEHFTLLRGTVHNIWSAVHYDDLEPNDTTIPFTFQDGHWQPVPVKDPGDWKQWIADVYHCSECWGQKQTEHEMFIELMETLMQKDPDDYSPHPSLYKECAAYWNELCDRYPQ